MAKEDTQRVSVDPGQLTPQQKGALRTNSGDTPIAKLDEEGKKALLATVLQRSLADERLEDIAADIGVHRSALNQALLKYAEEEWKSVQSARALTLVEDAEREMEEAQDAVAVSRARERLRSAQWKLERLHRRLFGADIPVDSTGKINIQINLGNNTPDAKVVDSDN